MNQKTYEQLKDEIWDALENKSELKLKKVIIEAMNNYLKRGITKEDLDELATSYITAPLSFGWANQFQFSDKKLQYVFEELSAIEEIEDSRAKQNVKRFILFLKNKEYDPSIKSEQ